MVFQSTLNACSGFPEAVEVQCDSFESNMCPLMVGGFNTLKPVCASMMACFKTIVESMR